MTAFQAIVYFLAAKRASLDQTATLISQILPLQIAIFFSDSEIFYYNQLKD